MAAVSAVACLTLLAVEVASGWHVLHSSEFFTALAAHKYVWANTLAAVFVSLFAVLAPGRWRWLAVIGPGLYLLGVLAATAILGGQALAMIAAFMTMAALWDTGERLLRFLGADLLSHNALVSWLAGVGPWSLGFLALGRVSLLRWWTVGILLTVLGLIGCMRLATRISAHRSSIARELDSPLSLASAGLILLTCGWAAIYTAAPEIQYDALYGKAFLPELWATTGHVGSLAQHVQFEITGWFQVLATYGHLLGAPATGRYLQLVALPCTAAAVWWWGKRHGALGPIAAVAVVITPHIFWQTTTADDDLLLALAALGFCMAVVESLRTDPGPNLRGVAFALGLMAGTGPSLKLHLAPLFACLLLGWIALGRSSRTVSKRFGYAALGAAVTAVPPMVMRWIDSGNPILPAYNNIFRSPYWPHVNEQANLPYWVHPGTFGPIEAIWSAAIKPTLMQEAAPPGAFGVLIGAVIVAVLLGWLGHDRSRATKVVWIALIPALVFWWASLRYLRYLLPISFVSVALVIMLASAVNLGRRARVMSICALALAVAASFPVTISQYWNVPAHKPPVYAALGHWKAASYLESAFTDYPSIMAFNRLSPANAQVATDAFQRVWLTDKRDLFNLHYEIVPLMEIHGPTTSPMTGDQAFADLRKLGIKWILVTEDDRVLREPGYLSQVLTTHGADEFSERGWDLYRLVSNPPRPVPLSACDQSRGMVPSCWGIPTTNDLTTSVSRSIHVCPGETLAVNVNQAPGGAPSAVLVQFAGENPADDIQPGATVPGTEQTIYATAPPGAIKASVTLGPSPGAKIVSANIARAGKSCTKP